MRDLYRHFVTFLFLLLVFAGCEVKRQKSADIKTKPNVLFILSDDLGYYDLSITGSQFYETPNIDRIAKEGMQFQQGYASCQVCSPSRASLLTGKTPARHGITDWIGALEGEHWRKQNRYNKLLPASYKHTLDTTYITLPEVLKKEGYTTFFAGKWHLGKEGSLPENHGFDFNVGGFEAGSPKGGYFSPYKNPNLKDGVKGENLSMRLAGETVNFFNQYKNQPFFAYLSFYAVHSPIQTTEEKWRKYQQKAERNGIAGSGYKMGKFLPIRQSQDNPVYGGLVESMDDAVGNVLDALDSLGLSENTIVVFTSDNGGVSAGDNFSTSNLPLKGGKGYQFEGGIRAPYFIKVPWLNNSGKVSQFPVSGTDFYPTILDLAGLEQRSKQHIDGVSLLPLLDGTQEKINSRSLIWHYPHYGNQGGEPSSIIRKGNWKLIYYYEDQREELYNLETDPYETYNRADEYPIIATQLSDELFVYLNNVGAKYPVNDPLYNQVQEAEYLKKVAAEKLPRLEQQRKAMLGQDFLPNLDWWGSQGVID